MKKLSILALAIFPTLLFSQEKYTIQGNLKGLKDSTLVFLTDANGNTIAQDYAFDGKFSLMGKADEPSYSIINFIGHQDKQIELFVSNNPIKVEGDFNKLNVANVSGGNIQADFTTYNNIFNPLKEKFGAVYGKINAETKPNKKDSLIKVFNEIKTKVIDQADNFIKSKPNSPVSPFIIYVINPVFGDAELVAKRYNMLTEATKKSMYGQMIAKMLEESKIGETGTMAVDFTQNDTANVPVSLSSFKGKYVLVDFWASWCRPCRAENPNVVKAFQMFQAKNFTVLGVSFDQQKENWLQAIKADRLTWTHVSDLKGWGNAVGQIYKISSIPQNMLIDPTGKIIGRNLRGEELITKLSEILK